MKRFLSVIREKVIPNLGNIIWDWKFNYEREREQPQVYFDLLERTLRAYKKEFSEDNEAVTLSESGEHEAETDDGKLPVRQNSASAESHGCAQQGKTKDSNR